MKGKNLKPILIALLSVILIFSFVFTTSLLNPSKKTGYKANSGKTRVCTLNLTTDHNILDYFSAGNFRSTSDSTGNLYLTGELVEVISTGSASNLENYGLRPVPNEPSIYEYSPLVYSSASSAQRYYGRNGINFKYLSNSTKSGNCLTKIDIFFDPSVAELGGSVGSIFSFDCYYQDGTVIRLKLPVQLPAYIRTGFSKSRNYNNLSQQDASTLFKGLFGSPTSDACMSGVNYFVPERHLDYNGNEDIFNYYGAANLARCIPYVPDPATAAARVFSPDRMYSYLVDDSSNSFMTLTTSPYSRGTSYFTAHSVILYSGAQAETIRTYFGMNYQVGNVRPIINANKNAVEEGSNRILDNQVDQVFYFTLGNSSSSDNSTIITEIDKVTTQIDKLKEEIDANETKIDSIKTQIDKKKTELEELINALKKQEQDNSDATHRGIEEIKNKITELVGTISTLSGNITTLTNSNQELINQVGNLQTNINTLLKNNGDLIESNKNISNQITNVQNEITEMKEENNQLEEQINNLNNELNNLRAILKNTLTDINNQLGIDSNSNLQDILKAIQDLQKELQNHKDTIKEINNMVQIDSSSSLQDSIDKIASILDELKELNDRIAYLKELAAANLKPGSNASTAEEALNQLIKEYNETKTELDRMNTFLKDCADLLGLDKDATTDEVLEAIRGLHAVIQTYKDTIANINKTVNIDSASSLQDSMDRVKELVEQLAVLNNRITYLKELATSNLKPGETTSSAEEALDKLIAEFNYAKSEVDRLMTFLNDCIKLLGLGNDATTSDVLLAIKDLQDRLDDAKERIAVYEKNLTDMSNVVGTPTDQMTPDHSAVISNKVSDMNRDLIATREELKTLREELKAITGTEGTSEAVAKLVADLRAQIQEAYDKIDVMIEINRKISQALGLGSGAELDDILKEIRGLHDQIGNLQQDKAKVNQDLTDALVKNSSLTSENTTIKDSNNYLKQVTNEQLAELLLLMNEKLKDSSETNDRLRELESKLESISDLGEVINNLESISQLQSDMDDLTEKLNSMDSKLDKILSLLGDCATKDDVNSVSDMVSNQVIQDVYGGGFEELLKSLQQPQQVQNNTAQQITQTAPPVQNITEVKETISDSDSDNTGKAKLKVKKQQTTTGATSKKATVTDNASTNTTPDNPETQTVKSKTTEISTSDKMKKVVDKEKIQTKSSPEQAKVNTNNKSVLGFLKDNYPIILIIATLLIILLLFYLRCRAHDKQGEYDRDDTRNFYNDTDDEDGDNQE